MTAIHESIVRVCLLFVISGCLASVSPAHPLDMNGTPIEHCHFDIDGHATDENEPDEAGHYRGECESHSERDAAKPVSDPDNSKEIIDGEQAVHAENVKKGDPTFSYNCHGYTFSITEGWEKCWVNDPETVIKEGHYVEIPKKFSHHWKYCDVVVYRDGSDEITHTGHVKEVVNGHITKMRSKWGHGAEWEHTPDRVPPEYTAGGGDWEVRRKCGMCINEYEYRGDGKYHVNERVKVLKVTGTANVSVGDILEPCTIVEVQSGTVRVVPVEGGKLGSGFGSISDCPGDYTPYTDIIHGSLVLEEYGTCDTTEHCGGYTPLAHFWVDVTPDTFITTVEVTHDTVENYTTIYNFPESPHDIIYSPRVGPDSGDCFTLSPGLYVNIDASGIHGPWGEYRIEDPAHWYHPPIKIQPNQNRTIIFKLFSIGNQALTYSVSSDHPCIQVSVPPSQLQPKDSIEISVLVDGTGACNGTFIAGNVVLSTDEAGGKVEYLRVHAVVADDYYECPRDPETVDTLENDYIQMYVNANCQQWIHDIGWDYPTDTTHEVFSRGGTIVATTSGGDTLVGRYMGDNDMRAGAQDKLYREDCVPEWVPPFSILYTKDVYIEATHLSPPAHFKWFWWEIAKQIRLFQETAPEEYQRIVIKYVKVKRQDPPGWWPDLTPFTSYDSTYIGLAMDLDAPSDSSGGGEPFVGNEDACNVGGYDAVNEIVYVSGFGREHPIYNDYHAGIALAEVNGAPTTTPYTTANVKSNQYLHPTYPWGWKDGELYQLASATGLYIQDPDSIVDRAVVMTAHKINAGDNPDEEAEFTLVEVLAPDGLAQMQTLVDTARAIVARERALGGLPAKCGDCNGDFIVNIGDIVYLVAYLYKSGPAPYCPTARGDVNNDGIINIGDVVYIVSFAYKSGPEPVCPGIWY